MKTMTKTLILFWVASLLGAVAFGAGDAQTGQTTTVSPPCQSSTDANKQNTDKGGSANGGTVVAPAK
jgi:hypothetical protein